MDCFMSNVDSLRAR